MTKQKTAPSQLAGLLKGLAFISLGCIPQIASAEQPSAVKDLTGKNLSQLTGLDTLGVDVGGWTAFGYTHNPAHPVDRSNGPVQFNNRANEFTVHQLGLFIEKAVDRNSQSWQLGGRFEAMFGTDANNTQATGHWDTRLIDSQNLRVYDIALPQAYAEVYTPFGNGISTKIGHFYSILGYESVPSPPNLFVSHSYSMKSSPFTMTGVLSSYAVNETFSVQAGAVTGPDNLDRYAGAWSFTGGFTLENQSHSRAFTFSILDGDVDDRQPSHLTYYYSMLRQDVTDNFHIVLQHDYGEQMNAIPGQRAQWYSVVNYLTYDLNQQWSAGLRSEWFHDGNGTRFSVVPGNYYDVSAGVNWKPKTWLTLRPELRYDKADGPRPFDGGTRKDQFLLSLDAVVRF